MNINNEAAAIHQANKEKGFWLDELKAIESMKNSSLFTDREVSMFINNVRSKFLLLVVCEIAEACEALRKDRYASLLAFGEEYKATGNLVEAFEKHIKDTYQDELADAIIRMLDLTGQEGIDIEKHIELKRLYNKTRPFKHGKNS